MNNDSGRINFEATLDTSQFNRSKQEVIRGFEQIGDKAESNGRSIDEMFQGLTRNAMQLAGTIGLGLGLTEFAQKVMSVRGQFQQLEIAFTTMLQSEEKAGALMSQLIETAAKTPFDLRGVSEGAKQLLAYGTAAEEVNETITRLGDIAAGLSLPLGDLVFLYGTTMTQGRMFTQDLRQFMGRGIPMAEELAKQFGVAKEEVGGLVTAGKVSAEMVKKAIWSMTDEGSKFGGLMAKQSQSITGQISNIEDAIDEMFNEIGKKSEGVINAGIGAVGLLVENWESVGAAILTAAEAFGIYKATLMAMSAYNSAAVNIKYDAEIAALERVLPLKEKEKATDIEQAVASGSLTAEKAELIAALREEARAHVENLKAIAAEDALKAESAKKDLLLATNRDAEAERSLRIYEKQYEKALELGDGEAIERAENELNTAASTKNATAKELQAAKSAESAAAAKAATSAKAAETAQTNLDSAATAGNTTATGILAQAKLALKRAIDAVNSSFLASPLFWIAAVIAGVTYAVYKLTTQMSESEKANKSFNETQKEINKNIATEQAEIDRLFNELRNACEGTKKYEEAKNAILNQYGKYLSGLNKEIATLKDVEGAYKAVTKAAREAAMARGMEAALKNAQESYGASYSENYEKLYEELKKKVGVDKAKKQMEQVRKDLQTLGKISANTQKSLMDATNNLSATEYDAQLNGGFTSATYKFIKNLNDNEARLKEYTENIGERFKTEDEIVEKRKTRNKAAIEEERETLQKELDALTTAETHGKKGIELKKQIAALTSELSAYNVSSSSSGGKGGKDGKGGGTTFNASQAVADAREMATDWQKQLQELLEDVNQQITDADIEYLDESTEKVLAKLAEDEKKELDAIEDRRKALIEKRKELDLKLWEKSAAGHDKYNFVAKSDQDYAALIEKEQPGLLAALEKRENQIREAYQKKRMGIAEQELSAMRAYLKEYGTIEQQRLAITQEYEKKIADAATDVEKMGLRREMEKALDEFDINLLKQEIDWSLMFDGVGDILFDEIKASLDKVEQYIKSDKFKSLAPTEQQALLDMRNTLKQKTGSGVGAFDFSIYGKIGEDLKKYQEAVRESKEAHLKHKEALDSLRKRESELASATTDAEKALAKSNLAFAKRKVEETSSEVKSADANVQTSKNDVVVDSEKAQKALDNFGNALQKMNSGSLKGFADGLINLIHAIGGDGKNNGLAGLGKAGGIIGAILTIIDTIGDDAAKFIEQLFEKVTRVIENLLKDLIPKVIPTLVTSILHLIEGVLNGIGGLVGSIFGQKFDISEFLTGGNEKKVAETTEELTESNMILAERISDLTEVIGESAGQKAISAYEAALKAQEEINRNQMEILKAQMGYHGSHHSNAYYADDEVIRGYNSDAQKAFQAAGVTASTITGLTSIYNLTPEQLKAIKDFAPDLWQYLVTVGKYDKSEYWESVVELAGKTEELTEQINDNLTQTSFDSLRDSFLDALTDMESSSKDFAKSFEDMMFGAVINSMVLDDAFDEWLRDWQKRYAEAVKQNDLGALSRLREEALNMRDTKVAERNAYADMMGYGGSFSQDSSKKGFATASQDSIDELNGRFTAIQMSAVHIEEMMSTGIVDLALINANVAESKNHVSDIVNLMVICNGHLESISKNTKELYSMREQLELIKRNTDKL